MNEESRDQIQKLAKELEEEFGSEVVEIFYEYFSIHIEEGMTTTQAAIISFLEAKENAKKDETLTQMG